MAGRYGMSYTIENLKLPGDVPCRIRVVGNLSGKSQHSPGTYRGALSFDVGKPEEGKSMHLSIGFSGHPNGERTAILNAGWVNASGEEVDLTNDWENKEYTSVSKLMQFFKDPLESLQKNYQSIPDEHKAGKLGSIEGQLHIERGEVDSNVTIQNDDIKRMLESETPAKVEETDDVKTFKDSLPLEFERGNSLNDIERGLVHLTTWLGASVSIEGTGVFGKPFTDLLLSKGRKKFKRVLPQMFRGMPIGQKGHTKIIKDFWEGKCK